MDFTLSNARRFNSSMGNPLGVKRFNDSLNIFFQKTQQFKSEIYKENVDTIKS